jgi:hypothetical protein
LLPTSSYRKPVTVAKLRLARDRIRKRDGKCEGPKSHAEARPVAVALARRLHKQGMGIERSARSSSVPDTSTSAAGRSTTRACAPCSVIEEGSTRGLHTEQDLAPGRPH